jgi:hypothetical protein
MEISASSLRVPPRFCVKHFAARTLPYCRRLGLVCQKWTDGKIHAHSAGQLNRHAEKCVQNMWQLQKKFDNSSHGNLVKGFWNAEQPDKCRNEARMRLIDRSRTQTRV